MGVGYPEGWCEGKVGGARERGRWEKRKRGEKKKQNKTWGGKVWKRRGGTGDGWRGGEGRYRGEEWDEKERKKRGGKRVKRLGRMRR